VYDCESILLLYTENKLSVILNSDVVAFFITLSKFFALVIPLSVRTSI